MTETEKKALALVNEVEGGNWLPHETDRIRNFATICRAIEQHEAFKREVSDAVESLVDMPRCDPDEVDLVAERLGRFIIAKADPLVEAVDELWTQDRDKAKYMADQLHKYLAARGGRIVWEGE